MKNNSINSYILFIFAPLRLGVSIFFLSLLHFTSASEPLDPYLLFARESIVIQNDSVIVSGDLGANGESLYVIDLRNNVTLPASSTIRADSIRLFNNTRVGNLVYNTLKTTPSSDIRGTSTTTLALPVIAASPAIAHVDNGDIDVRVVAGTIQSLPPGIYRKVNMDANSTLILTGDDYVFTQLNLQANAVIRLQSDAVITISDTLFASQNAVINYQFEEKRLILQYAGASQINIGAGARVTALIVAPDALLNLGSDLRFTGQIVAQKIMVGARSRLTWNPQDGSVILGIPLSQFSLFAKTKLTIGANNHVYSGMLGANNSLDIMSKSITEPEVAAYGQTIQMGLQTALGHAWCNQLLAHSTAVVRHHHSLAGDPVVEVFPDDPVVAEGNLDINLPSGAGTILNPGHYRKLSIGANATAALMPGEYHLQALEIGTNAIIQAAGPCQFYIASSFIVNNRVKFNVENQSLSDLISQSQSPIQNPESQISNLFPHLVTIHLVGKKTVNINAFSVFRETRLIALDGTINLSNFVEFSGTIWADKIVTGVNCELRAPTANDSDSRVIPLPAPASYPAPILVVLEHPDPAAVIYYGITPANPGTGGASVNSPSRLYTEPLLIDADTILSWKAEINGGFGETMHSGIYRIDTQPPLSTASPPAGSYQGAITVILSAQDDKSSSKIYYRVDQHSAVLPSAPVNGFKLYQKPLRLLNNSRVNWFAIDAAGNREAPRSADYAITPLDPAADLDRYVLFAEERIEVKANVVIRGGDIGANSLQSPNLIFRRNADLDPRSTIRGHHLFLENNVSAGFLQYNKLTMNPTAVIGAALTPITLPLISPLPAVELPPGVSPAAGVEMTVNGMNEFPLTPGVYRRIEIKNNAGMVLAGGQYYLNDLICQPGSVIRCLSDTRIYIARLLDFAANVAVNVDTAGSRLQFVYDQKNKIDIGNRSRLNASLLAPLGRVVVGADCELTGQVAAERIEIGPNSRIWHRPMDDDAPLPDDAGMRLPPETFSLLGLSQIRIGSQARVMAGILGANGIAANAIEFQTGASAEPEVILYADKIKLAANMVIGQAWYNTASSHKTTTILNPHTPITLPVLGEMPPSPVFIPGFADLTIPAASTTSVTPGRFNRIIVRDDATITFAAGDYYVNSLRFGNHATARFAGPAHVYIASSFYSGQGLTWNQQLPYQDVRVTYQGAANVTLGNGSNVRLARLEALNARVLTGANTHFSGVIWANVIDVGANSVVTTHDTQPPSVFIEPFPGFYEGPIAVTFSVDEPATVYYSLDDTIPSFQSSSFILQPSSPSPPFALSNDATIIYFAVDAQGNSSDLEFADYLFFIQQIPEDDIPPVITITQGGAGSLPADLVTNQPVTPVITVTDNFTPSSSLGIVATLRDLSAVVETPFSSGTSITAEGAYTLTVQAVDSAGNESITTVTFTIDNTAPVVSISGVFDQQITNQPVTPIITITDPPFVSFVPFVVKLNDLPFSSGTSITGEGAYTLTVQAVDSAGNESITTVTFIIDTSPPVITVTAPANQSTVRDLTLNITGFITDLSPSVSLTINSQSVNLKMMSDIQSEISNVSNEANLAMSVLNSEISHSFSHSVPLPVEGANTITLKAADQFNHITLTTLTIDRDTTAPNLSVQSPANGLLTRQPSITVTGSVNGGASIVTINDQNVDLNGTAFSAPIILAEGINVLMIKAFDPVGNQTSVTRLVTLDTRAPVISNLTPSNNHSTSNPSITLTGAVADPGNFNNANTIININGETVPVLPDGKFSQVIGLVEGNNAITIVSNDLAGNRSTYQTTVYRDSQPPRITITTPANGFITAASTITVSGAIDDPAATVTVNGQSATITNSQFTAIIHFPVSSVPSVSSVVINATATDPAGNSSSASVTVTRDTVPPVIAILSPANNLIFNKTSIAVIGTIDDPSATVTVNGQPAAVANGKFLFSSLILPASSLTITATATDIAGNTAVKTHHLIIDLTPPEPPRLDHPPLYSNSTQVFLSGSAEPFTTLTMKNSQFSILNSFPIPAAGTFSVTLLLEPDVANTFNFTVTDAAGNISAPLTHTIINDTIAPVITILAPPLTPARLYQSVLAQVLLTGIVSDNHAGGILPNGSPDDPALLSLTINSLPGAEFPNPPIPITLSPDAGGIPRNSRTEFSNQHSQISFSFSHLLTFPTTSASPQPSSFPLTLTVTDVAGNSAATSFSVNVTFDEMDNKPPVISVISPIADSILSTYTFDLVLSVIDQSAVSDLVVNGTSVLSAFPLDPITRQVVVPITIPDRQSEITNPKSQIPIIATDVFGHTATFTHTVSIDTGIPAAPQITQITPTNPLSPTGWITKHRAVTIYGAAEPHATLVIHPSSFTLHPSIPIPASGIFIVPLNLALNQLNTFSLTVIDAAGNQSTAVQFDITHDNVLPLISINGIASGSSYNSTVTPVITASDPPFASFVPSVVQLNSSPFVSGAAISSEGSYSLSVSAVDLAGNTAAAGVNFTIDKTAPVVSISGVFDQQITNQPVTPIITITDPPFVSFVPFVVKLNDHPFSSGTSITAEGAYTLTVQAVDSAGNESITTVTFTIDKTAPVISISGVTDTHSYNSSVTPVISVSDNFTSSSSLIVLATLRELSSLVETPFTSGATISAPGSYTLTVQAVDTAGNESVTTVTFTIGAAPAKPIIDSVSPASPTNQNHVTISGFATPGTSLHIHNSSLIIPNFSIPSSGLFTITVDLIPNAANTITLSAVNSYDLASSAATVTIIQDSTPPSVVSILPSAGSVVSATTSIAITFSEPLDSSFILPASSCIKLLDHLNAPVPGALSLSASGKTVNFFPARQLAADAGYKILIDASPIPPNHRITDLAGNHLTNSVTVNFTTAPTTIINRLPAPVLDPQPPPSTLDSAITLTGYLPIINSSPSTLNLQPSSFTLHILGGIQPVSVSLSAANSSGNQSQIPFSVTVPLFPDSVNSLALYAVEDDVTGEYLVITIRHFTRPPGIRILTPQADFEYQNPSVTVMGVIDSPEFVDLKSIRVAGVAAGVTPADTDFAEVGLFGNYFARQIVFTTPGPKTVIAKFSLPGSNDLQSEISFLLAPEPAGIDTKPPLVKIVFPESGYVANRVFIEVMGTVEEGVALSSLLCDGVHAHAMIGNIFLVYKELSPSSLTPSAFPITVIARDQAGLTGQDTVTVFLDDSTPAVPQVDETPALTDNRIQTLTGAAAPGSVVVVTGGLIPVRGVVDESGHYQIAVPLNPNTVNHFAIITTDEHGNSSAPVKVTITHDDQRPFVVSVFPSPDAARVPVDARVTITFSEPIRVADVSSASSGSQSQILNLKSKISASSIPGSLLFSADQRTITFIPTAKFQRDDTITVEVGGAIADAHGLILGEPYTFSFRTAAYVTTLSGVVLDDNFQPLEGIRVGILDSSFSILNSQLPINNSSSSSVSAFAPLRETFTNTFGAFLLDDVPEGDHILFVNRVADVQSASSSSSPPLQPSVSPQSSISNLKSEISSYPYLEYLIPITKGVDNSLGRPIFLTPIDLSSLKTIDPAGADLTFTDIPGFTLSYAADSAILSDPSALNYHPSSFFITATLIDPAFIPDRLPSGAIPHFLVFLDPINNSSASLGDFASSREPYVSFSPPASLVFPNLYELAPGEKVRLFHFQYGMHNYRELGEIEVDLNGEIVTGPLLDRSGFFGIIPANPDFDLTKSYLRGRVVGPNGAGIPGIAVNAMGSSTAVYTDVNGEYTIPLPEVRLFLIQTYASIPTTMENSQSQITNSPTPNSSLSSNSLIFPSAAVEVAPSGITNIPDIVVNTYFISGDIRFVNAAGNKVPRTGLAFSDGTLVSLDDSTPRSVEIHVLKRVADVQSASSSSSSPSSTLNLPPPSFTLYASTTAVLDPTSTDFDAAYSVRLVVSHDSGVGSSLGDLASLRENSSSLRPGDLIKIVAFSPSTGWYAEHDLLLPTFVVSHDSGVNSSSPQSAISNLQSQISFDLHPPVLSVDVSRSFFVDGIRRREPVLPGGIVFTSDEFIEVKTHWQGVADILSASSSSSSSFIPQPSSFPSLPARLLVETLKSVPGSVPDTGGVVPGTDLDDHFFSVPGGLSTRVLELREALVPNRLSILGKPTDVGRETFSFSPGATFAPDRLIKISNSPPPSLPLSDLASLREFSFYVISLSLTQNPDGTGTLDGLALPGLTLTISDQTITAGPDGRFHLAVPSLPANGIAIRVGAGPETRFGASFTPELISLTPDHGSQGDTITIVGRNFSEIPQNNKVKFNGAAAIVTAASPTELQVIVPNDAAAGPVTVTVASKISNPLFFDFISLGLPNGSFESGFFRGYVTEGTARVAPSHRRHTPTDGDFLATLETAGIATPSSILTTDRFYVPEELGYLIFDFNLLASLLTTPAHELVTVQILIDDTAPKVIDVLPANLELFFDGEFSAYEKGSGWQSAVVDLQSYAGTSIPIRVQFILNAIPHVQNLRPGHRADDANLLGYPSRIGTGLLLDNLRLGSSGMLPPPLSTYNIVIAFSIAGGVELQGMADAVTAGSRVWARALSSSQLYEAVAADDGSFTLPVTLATGGRSFYLLSYHTPKTTTNATSNRLFSPGLWLEVTP